MALHLKNFELVPVIQETISMVMPLLDGSHNTLEIDLADDLGTMHADVTHLRQVIFTLLLNAARSTQNGVVTFQATRESINETDWIRLRVRDTGIGISPEKQRQIFNLLAQTEVITVPQSNEMEVGLAISRRLCRLMGGDITLESVEGKGSTFTVYLPACGISPAPVNGNGEGGFTDEDLAQSLGGTISVLVIDDDPQARDLITRILLQDQQDFEVITAATAQEGLDLARAHPPDVITLDVLLPDINGWQVLTQLKQNPQLAGIPVVMLTMVDDPDTGFALQAADYLTKPIDRDILIHTLQKYQPHESVLQQAGKPVVLVIEDSTATRVLHRRVLEQEGWQVMEATNGLEGLQCMRETLPHLIILDLMMPQMNGFEFLEEMRKEPTWKDIPVLVITAKDIGLEDRRRLDGYVRQILQKGNYRHETLLSEVRYLIVENLKHKHES